ncbi:MAG: hypothetical protein MNPFHGCM_01835 [Gemmatimonadaceae bacterium]|nr:hypothetical protein [Gemmatimonadaceae bacterium]
MRRAKSLPPAPAEVLRALAPLERLHYRLAWHFNQDPLKRFMALFQYSLGSIAIRSTTARRTRVFGMEHVAGTSLDRPLLLVANHRSYFDMFVVSSEVFRHTGIKRHLYFPIMGSHYYQTLTGIALNATVGFWSMFPPLFANASHKDIDRHSLDLLVHLCSDAERTMVGIHPEGGRNLDPDVYTLRRVQPGTGRIIHAARPQVIPVFVVGLENTFWRQVAASWSAKDPIRIHFGRPIDLTSMYELPPKGSTYKAITDVVMDRVRDLMEDDRALYGQPAASLASPPEPSTA